MSSFVKHQAPSKGSVRIALVIGAVWFALLAAIWLVNRDGAEPGGFLHFLARFHVIVVHLPIGLIFLALAMAVLGHFQAFSPLRQSLPFVLWMSLLGSVAATLAGYLLMAKEDYSGRAMDLHLYFGLGVVVTTLAALILEIRDKRGLSGLATAAAAFATAASGHFGGAMVHEADYLTEHAPEAFKPALHLGLGPVAKPAIAEGGDPSPGPDGEATVEPAAEKPVGDRLVYEEFVVPILEKTCNECHNENKIKGKLRMDTHEMLLAGASGSDYPTVVPGKADESEMIVRVLLPADDDEFMPPQGDPLKPAEIELLKRWINAGAQTGMTVAQLGDDPAIAAAVTEVLAIHTGGEVEAPRAVVASGPAIWDTLPDEEKSARLDAVHEAAEKYHFAVMPLSAEDDRLRVNVVNAAKDFGDEQLKLLEPVAERIVWLDLARSQITDAGMQTVKQMRDLERLHLENTAISDAGIAELAALPKLQYLNLYGTRVGNGVFKTFSEIPSLKKVYVWQTGIDAAAAKAYERSVNLEINTGVELAQPPPAPPSQEIKGPEPPKDAEKKVAKKEEKKPEPKKAEPKKAEAPKPAPAKAAGPPAKPAPKQAEAAKPAPAKPAPKQAEAAKPAPAKPAPPKSPQIAKAKAPAAAAQKPVAPEGAAPDPAAAPPAAAPAKTPPTPPSAGGAANPAPPAKPAKKEA